MRRNLLGLCMIVKNEARNLIGLLELTHDLFDEICICDTGSTDGTIGVAATYGAKVCRRLWDDDFAAARNASLNLCESEWIIWLDGDDRMWRDDIERLRLILEEAQQDQAFYMYLLNVGPNDSCNQLRVFPNLPGIRFEGRLHEQVVPTLKEQGVERYFYYPITVHHLGYADKAAVKRKFIRNYRLTLVEALVDAGANPLKRYYIAQTLDALGYKAEANVVYGSLMSLWSEDATLQTIIARSRVSCAEYLMVHGKHDEAAKILEQGCALFRDDDLMWLTLARARYGQKRWREAANLAQYQLDKGFNPGVLPYSAHMARWLAEQVVWESHKKIMLDGKEPPNRAVAA